jgi:hypothetical protein
MGIARHRPFGFSPKISTPVEKTVEKRHVAAELFQEPWFLAGFRAGKPDNAAVFGPRMRVAVPFLRR